MTTRELGETYISLGQKLVEMHKRAGGGHVANTPSLEPESALGAAAFLCFLRDLITSSPLESYSKPSLLVLLETLSRDVEVFPHGIGVAMWGLEEGEDIQ